MSAYTVLHGRRSLQVATQRLVIPVDEVGEFTSAVQCAQALTSLLEHERTRVAQALAAAQAEGLAEGRRDAEQAAGVQVAEAVARMVREVHAQREAARDAVGALALAVVAKLSAQLGAARVVPLLIEQAVQELLPERAVRVRVSPTVIEAVRRHVGTTGLAAELRADETLGEFDCVIDSRHGQAVVGLDAQLAAVGRALGVPPTLDIEVG